MEQLVFRITLSPFHSCGLQRCLSLPARRQLTTLASRMPSPHRLSSPSGCARHLHPPHPGCLHHLRPLRNPHRDCREQKTAGAGNTGCGYWGTRCPRLIPASVKLTSEEPNWCHAGPAQPPFSTPKWRGDGFQIPRKGSGTCGEAPEVTALPGQGERHPAPWPCIRPPPPPLLDSFQLHPGGKRGLDFGPGP